MNDEEIICTFMEPKPPDTDRGERGTSPGGWWKLRWSVLDQRFRAWPNDDKTDSLDALWEVEERLTDEQWYRYTGNLPTGRWWSKELAHATAAHKIKALASVLRPEVEKR